MPYLFVTALFPNDKSKEVAKTYVNAITKYPEDANISTPVVPVGVHATLEGMKVIMIYDVKKGKLDETWALLDNRMSMFMDIQGITYVFEYYSNLEEALKTIGM